jgi:hypothetical protein
MRQGLLLLAMVIVAAVVAQVITIFVIQPIGAVPDGRTLIISRLNTLQFVDSADAWCERQQGGVNLLCRIAVMGRVAEEATILARLPYSAVLYQISTGGKCYER